MSVSPVNSCCAADLSVQETQDPSGSQVDEAARRQLGLLDSEENVVASAATPSALPVLSETARGGGPSLPTRRRGCTAKATCCEWIQRPGREPQRATAALYLYLVLSGCATFTPRRRPSTGWPPRRGRRRSRATAQRVAGWRLWVAVYSTPFGHAREARDRTSASVNLEHIVTSEWLRPTESVLKEAGLPRQDIAVCTLANASENSARGEKPLSCFGTDADLTNSKLYHPDETRSKAKRTRLAKATCHGVLSITFVQQDTKSLGSKAITGHFMAFLSTRVGSPGCGGMPPRSRAALRAGLL